MPRHRGRPPGSSTDDYIIGFMAGLLWLLGPSDARYLARLAIKLGQVPRGGSDASRIDRLTRKMRSGQFRRDTQEWRDGLTLVKRINAQIYPALGPPLMEYFDTSECESLADMMKLARRKRAWPSKLRLLKVRRRWAVLRSRSASPRPR